MSVPGPGDPAASGSGPALAPTDPAAVPPGPGVVPPFPAPPTEGRRARVWWGFGVGALALVLCCGGGAAALIGLGLVSERAFNEQATTVIGDYLDAVRDKRYDEAYGLLCDELQDAETPTEFAGRLGALEGIQSYDVGQVSIASTDPDVPVEIVYNTGRTDTLQVRLRQDSTTGEFEVCGIEE